MFRKFVKTNFHFILNSYWDKLENISLHMLDIFYCVNMDIKKKILEI